MKPGSSKSIEERASLLRRLASRLSEMAGNLEDGRKMTAVWGVSATSEDWEAFSFGVQTIAAVKANLIRNGVFLLQASRAAQERQSILDGEREPSAQAPQKEEAPLPVLPKGFVVREDADS